MLFVVNNCVFKRVLISFKFNKFLIIIEDPPIGYIIWDWRPEK